MIYGYREERRVAAITEVPIDAFASVPEPTPTDLSEFHKSNEPEFTAPERRAIDYIHLSPDDFAKRIVVSQDDLVAAFEDRAEEFGIPETRKTLQMVVSEEAQARTASERLAAGQEFVVVAGEVEQCEAVLFQRVRLRQQGLTNSKISQSVAAFSSDSQALYLYLYL